MERVFDCASVCIVYLVVCFSVCVCIAENALECVLHVPAHLLTAQKGLF